MIHGIVLMWSLVLLLISTESVRSIEAKPNFSEFQCFFCSHGSRFALFELFVVYTLS
jgi:hypothetical protein